MHHSFHAVLLSLFHTCLKFLTISVFHAGAKEKYGLEIGDHAISENIIPCWECRYCKRGKYNMC